MKVWKWLKKLFCSHTFYAGMVGNGWGARIIEVRCYRCPYLKYYSDEVTPCEKSILIG